MLQLIPWRGSALVIMHMEQLWEQLQKNQARVRSIQLPLFNVTRTIATATSRNGQPKPEWKVHDRVRPVACVSSANMQVQLQDLEN